MPYTVICHVPVYSEGWDIMYHPNFKLRYHILAQIPSWDTVYHPRHVLVYSEPKFRDPSAQDLGRLMEYLKYTTPDLALPGGSVLD